ncbi:MULTISPECIES: helix-turn-helix domain-containing protein [unclassified Kitasatospora]|uniref:helix-turn-helix domain-containing protein n=1 Tax=unclassified Kitasatospora TaxID=2633591 RepID=UPI000708CD12|nr:MULTISPECIES: helix-turn-helix domain-containing protein [unclassified Kitasatospora]KQV14508.1 DNA-binding protein [Kitasatospora sp. Root107]KRB68046.1 DNA-binding protein [Kitasatospora sp. Root187]
MHGIGAETDGTRGVFAVDSTAQGAAPRGLDAFRRGWETQVGDDVFQLPDFTTDTVGDFRVKGNVAKVHDAAIADLHAASATRTADVPGGDQDLVAMYVVRHGAWTLGGPPGQGDRTVSAGQFLVRHVGSLTAFETSANLTAKFLVLPPAELKPLLGNRVVTGPADSAEMRLLTALTDMIHTTVADLGPAGVAAAQGTLVELAKAVAKGRFDDVEPRLAPALTQAAKDLADRLLTHPELSPAMLARELNVSVRTLHRAFAAVGEQVTTYIRHRRLHEARLALDAPSGRLSISELAAHWQFADGSHFTRAFKKHYGQTPSEYARSAAAASLSPNRHPPGHGPADSA